MLKEPHTEIPPFVAYEYKEITIEKRYAERYIDGFASYGWQSYDVQELQQSPGIVVLHMKRDRTLVNRTELTRLQQQFEVCMADVAKLEGAGKDAGTMAALIAGVMGGLLIAGGIFAALSATPQILLTILLILPGTVFCCMALRAYSYAFQKQTERVKPFLHAKQEEISAICEKGHRLLYK